MLTLTGPGGIGKTRLAIAAAEALVDRGVDVRFVPLDTVADPAAVLPRIAAIVDSGGRRHTDSLATLVTWQKHSSPSTLLVLDNLEHLDCGPALADIFARCPDLDIIATSRTVVGCADEQVLTVEPLAVPPEVTRAHRDEILGAPAVSLLVQRMQMRVPSLIVSDADLPRLAAIARGVDGIPLAIELAAAMMPDLGLADLDRTVRERSTALQHAWPDRPPRQRSVRAMVEASLSLLDDRERTLFRQLGGFAGRISLAGARAVDATSGEPDNDDLDARMRGLERQHLIVRLPDAYGLDRDDARAWTMMRTIRDVAAECLAEAGETDSVIAALAAWYAERLGPGFENRLLGPDQRMAFAWLDAEIDTLRSVLRWLMDRGDAAGVLRLMCSGVHRFHLARGTLGTDGQVMERALGLLDAAGDGDANLTARTCIILARRMQLLDRPSDARVMATRAVTTAREGNDPEIIARALTAEGHIALDHGDGITAKRRHEEALAIRRGLENPRMIATSLINLGDLAVRLGQPGRAIEALDEAIIIADHAQDLQCTAYALHNLAEALVLQGDYAAALAAAERSRTIADALSDGAGSAWAMLAEIPARAGMGDLERSRECLAELLNACASLGDPAIMAQALERGMMVAERIGRPDAALSFLACAEHVRARGLLQRLPEEDMRTGKACDRLRAAITPAQFTLAWSRGQTMSPMETMELLADLREDAVPVTAPPIDWAARSPAVELTSREMDVLGLLVEGATDREIAATLGLSARTVSNRVRDIAAKFDVTTRSAIVSRALRMGLV
ncbi:MAG: LuxR C-terminal-related transcriptional regulator [Thermomicrobiales bacterium]